jgi:hypothetical protein
MYHQATFDKSITRGDHPINTIQKYHQGRASLEYLPNQESINDKFWPLLFAIPADHSVS